MTEEYFRSVELKPPKLQWFDSKTPFSKEYEDRFYSDDNPLDECKHVYLNSNGLPNRWIVSTRKRFTIAEIGFGFGLNFILSAALHAEHRVDKQLHYIAFEKSPPTKKQAHKLFKNFPELEELSLILINKLPKRISGCHRIHFSGNITLDLHYGDIQEEMSDFELRNLKISAWFIDGFSPKTNPSIWSSFVCKKISQFSSSGTTLTSYSAAGTFRRNLATNGFEVKKASGFGRKRHMTIAKLTTSKKPSQNQTRTHDISGSVAVIGAGIAGCAAAYSLAKRNISVQLFESKEDGLHEKSGVSLLALRPRLFKNISSESEFFLHSYLYATSQFNLHSIHKDVGWNQTGVIQLEGALNKRVKISQGEYYSIYPDSILRTLTNKQARDLSKLNLSVGGLYFPDGGFVETAKLCSFYLDTNGITKNYSAPVQSINYSNGMWTLYSPTKNVISQVKAVIIANSHCLTQFNQTEYLPVSINHGYSNWFNKSQKQDELSQVICGEKTIFPSLSNGNKGHLVSATYENTLTEYLKLKAIEKNLTGANRAFTNNLFLLNQVKGNEAGTRCGTPDRVPYIGQVPNLSNAKKELAHLKRNAKADFSITDNHFWPNLYITAGHGSNGLSTSTFGAEILASFINQEPIPASKRHLNLICPSRVIVKDLKKQRV